MQQQKMNFIPFYTITPPSLNPLLEEFGWTCAIAAGAFVAADFIEGLGGIYASRIAGRLGI